MSVTSAMSCGPSSRFARTRGRLQGGLSQQGLSYPSPFFDIAHTWLPTSIKKLFRWCRYYFLTNPLINATIFKLSEYPITEVVVDHERPEVVKRWTEYLQDHLRIRPFQVECGLDYHCFGNCAVSINYPFKKYLSCLSCDFTERADKLRNHYRISNFQFRLNCPKCGNTTNAKVNDYYYRDASGISLMRWNVEDIDVRYNDVTGESTYYYTIPRRLKSDLMVGRKHVVETTPQRFMQALQRKKGIVFSENFFHFKRPTIAHRDRGWGTPLLLPVLKDTFYLQIMKKAQEAILLEHIVPLRVLFPQAGSGSSDPYTSVNLGKWKEHISTEIARWRMDCVSPESLIETEKGLRRADTIKEGDLLKNERGSMSRVDKVWSRPLREEEDAYQVLARGLRGAVPTVSAGHPFKAARSFNKGNGHKLGEATYIRVSELRPKDYVGYPVHRPKKPVQAVDLGKLTGRASTEEWVYLDHTSSEVPCAFEHLSSSTAEKRSVVLERYGWSVTQYKSAQGAIREGRGLRRLPRYLPFDAELAWVVGIYLAEGSVSPKQVLFALNRKEKSIQARLRTFFMERFGATGTSYDKSPEGIQLVFSSVVAAELFHHLCPGDSHSKRIAQVYRECEDCIAASLVQGLLTGDGCFHQDGVSNKTTIMLASRQLIADVRLLLLAVGIIPGLYYEPAAPYNICGKTGVSSEHWGLGVNGASNNRLHAWLAGNKLPPIHSKIGLIRDGYIWHRVKEIRRVTVDRVIGFQMDREAPVYLEDDTEAHGTFCLWGMASVNSNYIPILPLPIGQQTIGGDGKALLLTQEMQAWSEHIMMGMGVPREFLLGGMSYSGTNVSMRMLENAFIGYISRHKQFLRWVVREVASFMRWPEVKARFKPFKMADDLQRKALLFQYNQAQKLSDTTLLADADLNQGEEDELMIKETEKRLESTKKQQLAMAEVQAEQQLIMSKAQVKAQQAAAEAQMAPAAPGEPGGPEASGGTAGGQEAGAAPPGAELAMQSPLGAGQRMAPPQQGQQPQAGAGQAQPGMDITQMATQLAQQLAALPKDQQQMALETLQAQSPELAQLVHQMLSQQGGQGADMGMVDQRAQPEQKPPRRDTPSI